MAQKEIEMILFRQVASYLAMPIFIVDGAGTLVFYNESAEELLGRRFEETGEMSASEWAMAWAPRDREDKPLPPEALPLSVALNEGKPAYQQLRILGHDHVARDIEAVAFPLIGQAGRQLGAVVIFCEAS